MDFWRCCIFVFSLRMHLQLALALRKFMAQWLPTRVTLIRRLKDWQDQASWQQFFDTYWRIIHSFALRSGLNESETMHVVQEIQRLDKELV